MSKRFDPEPTSAPGDFYIENHCCTQCGVPQVVHRISSGGSIQNRVIAIGRNSPRLTLRWNKPSKSLMGKSLAVIAALAAILKFKEEQALIR